MAITGNTYKAAISANTLFHFTDKKGIKGILQRFFYPKYSLEDLSNATPLFSEFKDIYIPMACFCDLVFSQIKSHIDFYGDYGIGLSKKKWGLKKGISPIVYVPEDSTSALTIQSIAKSIYSEIKTESEKRILLNHLQNLYKYVKPYEGYARNKRTGKKELKQFYDEREWRYVPNFPVIKKKDATKKLINKKNRELKVNQRLNFKAHEIKYIIVKEEKEIPSFVKFIEEHLFNFSEPERKLLVSKLISVEQIKDDV